MEIPLNVQVECTDGVCGRSAFVLINPIIEEVTHLVVREDSSPSKEYVVPVDMVDETIADTIQLRCSKAELEKMDPFIVTRYIKDKMPERFTRSGGAMIGTGTAYYLPYNAPDITISTPVDEQQIPPGELAVYRGTRVEATDGYVGKVDEFVVNPQNCHITHLVMREGHLWGKKDVIIPLSAISETRQDIVYLNLNKHQIEALPTFPMHRRWS
jgi:sporulation protein YlmC with PRC-barrel domain